MTLNLVLLPQWYQQVEAGIKTREYRDATPYYIRRLCNARHKGKCPLGDALTDDECAMCFEKNLATWEAAPYDRVCFRLKQSSATMTVPIKGIGLGKDVTGRKLFVISLEKSAKG